MTGPIRFGLSGHRGGFEGLGPTPTIELARLAEELGFDCLWFNEEHLSRPGRPRGRDVLSPIVLAAAVATATETIRVGFSVLLAPLHHPLRLAEDLATLDVLSNGRVNVGLSTGNNPRYHEAFGLRPGTGPTLADLVDAMIKYWSGAALTVDSAEHYLSPLPVQDPHPPLFVGAYRRESLEWAAGRGFPVMQTGMQSLVSLRRCLDTYAAAGGDVSRVPVGRFCYVADTDAQARAEAWPVVSALAARLHQIGLWRAGDLIITEAELEPERFFRETAIIGGPETVAARLIQLRDEQGVRYVNLLSSFFGFMPEQLFRPSLHRFSQQVMPLVRSSSSSAGPLPQPERRA